MLSDAYSFGWDLVTDVLPVGIINEAQSFLSDSTETILMELGCDMSSSTRAGRWCAETLDSAEGESLSDTAVTLMRGHFPPAVRMNERILNIAGEIHRSDVLLRLFGRSFPYLHLPPMARFVLPGNFQAGVPPHYDWQYNTHMSSFVNVWVPLVEITESRGGVNVYESADTESHNVVPEQTQVASTGLIRHWHKAINTTGKVAVPCVPMKPGDVLAFGSNVLHGSMANSSDSVRISLEFRFLPAEGMSSRPVLNVETNDRLEALGQGEVR